MFHMNAVDVKCPICEKLNKLLNLEETDGWMECENCGNAVQILNPDIRQRNQNSLLLIQSIDQRSG